jgi:hypothetical protein
MRLGPGSRKRAAHFLIDLCARIALRAARSALVGTAGVLRGNRRFDAQAAVFAHGQFVK